MYAFVLLLAVEPPPATLRVDLVEIRTVGDTPPVVISEMLEAAVAVDGRCFARVIDGDRTRTLKGKLQRQSGRWFCQVGYQDVTLDGWVPVAPGKRERIENVFATDTFLGFEAVGHSIETCPLVSRHQPNVGPMELCVKKLTVSLLPRGGAPHLSTTAVIPTPEGWDAPEP